MVLLLASLFTLALAAPPTPAAAAPEIPRKMHDWLTETDFRGNVLVARGGAVLLEMGFGMADRENGVAFNAATVFPIGSITKQFTAAAILKLEMEGKLRVEDAIAKYVPGVPADKRAITLHHLLTHTAGLESDFAGDFDEVGRDEYVKRILASPLRSEPGAAYFYANSGYSLLGAIVELVSGQPYEVYLRDNLFAPAGMQQTGYRLPKWGPRSVAVGYLDGKRWGRLDERPWAKDGPYWALRANGGLHSTLGDLFSWHRALKGEKILSATAKEKFYARHVREHPAGPSYYGYGWAIEDSPWGGRLIAHNGGNRVFYADFRRFVDEDLVIVVATNDSTLRGGQVADALARLAHGEDAPPPIRPNGKPLGVVGRDATIRAWLEAFNTGDAGAMRAFRVVYAGQRPDVIDEERERALQRMQGDLGRLEAQGVVGESAKEVIVRAKSSRGPTPTLRFMFDENGKWGGVAVELGD